MSISKSHEIYRLIWYARGMGVKVKFKRYIPRSYVHAYWLEDGSEITIFFKPGMSLRYLTLSLIHELGHHKDYIHRGRKEDILFSKAHDKIEDRNKRNKKYWKTILKTEIEGTKYWFDIYRDTGCTFPIKYLYKAMDKDIWVYRFAADHSRDPNIQEKKDYDRFINQKYGKDYNDQAIDNV